MFWNRIATRGGRGGGGGDGFVGRPLGRVLTKMGKLTREQVVFALNEQKYRGGPLGRCSCASATSPPPTSRPRSPPQRGEGPPAGRR